MNLEQYTKTAKNVLEAILYYSKFNSLQHSLFLFLVFYRHDFKPICIYNISLLALFLVKLFNPQIKTNILSASFAKGFNILLNSLIFFYLYFFELRNLSFSLFLFFCLLYFIKIFIIPLCLVSSQNSKYGPHLVHSSFFKGNASDVIHV